jgi:hypothetical protein
MFMPSTHVLSVVNVVPPMFLVQVSVLAYSNAHLALPPPKQTHMHWRVVKTGDCRFPHPWLRCRRLDSLALSLLEITARSIFFTRYRGDVPEG